MEKSKSLYSSEKDILIKTALKLYKFIFSETTTTVNEPKTEEVKGFVLDIDLEKIIKETLQNAVNVQKGHFILTKRVELLPLLIDYLFIYYLRMYRDQTPFEMFPKNVDKLNLIFKFVGTDNSSIEDSFRELLKINLIVDIKHSVIPYHMRTLKTEEEIKKELLEIEEYCKFILECLVKAA